MTSSDQYYVVKEKAVPEVLLKVVEVNRLRESNRSINIQKATEMVGISRSSYYKYKDDISPFHENAKGKPLTFVMTMRDTTGLLSKVLSTVALFNANIMAIHQTIPINGMATVTLTVEIRQDNSNASDMIRKVESLEGIYILKIIGREREK